MVKEINISEIFSSLSGEYYEKYKNTNGVIKKYFLQTRYEALFNPYIILVIGVDLIRMPSHAIG